MKKLLQNFLKSLNTPLIANMLSVGVAVLFVKLFGFYKETVVASEIGLSELLDTYYIAILIPGFIQSVFVGALKNLFIPNYIAEQRTNNQLGAFQSASFLIISIIVIILSLLSIVFVKWGLEFVFPGHSINYYQLIRSQFYVVLPCLVFWGYSSLLSGLLEIENKFFITSLSGIFTAFSTLIALFAFRDVLGDQTLSVGILGGSIMSFVFLLLFSFKENILQLGKIVWSDNLKIMLHQLPPKTISGFLTGINPFVDQFFAAQLVVGSIGAINYGLKIPAFVVTILIMVIGNVLLPHFSKLVQEDIKKAYEQLFKILKIVFFGSLVCSVFTMFISESLIEFLFERNEFTSEDTKVVSKIQIIALAYVPFYLCTLICVKFLTAINKNKFMAWTSFWNLVINLILNIILIKKYGLYGLVLSTTFVYIISSFIYVGFTFKQFKRNFIIKN